MNLTYLVADNFFEDPDRMREKALKMRYSNPPRLPYRRTDPITPPKEAKKIIKELHFTGRQIHYFQVLTRRKTFVHIDKTPSYAGIVFLNKDPAHYPGTNLMRHKKLGYDLLPHKDPKWLLENNLFRSDQRLAVSRQVAKDKYDLTQWELVTSIEAKYNRFILFRTDLFHMNASGWGTNQKNGRLTYNFFHFNQNDIKILKSLREK